MKFLLSTLLLTTGLSSCGKPTIKTSANGKYASIHSLRAETVQAIKEACEDLWELKM